MSHTTKTTMAPEALPPAQPTYVLRGHAAHVHALHFMRGNSRLMTGDASGWAVYWDVTYKRAVAVWQAHQNAILGFGDWEERQAVITHGRDNRLIVWQLGHADEKNMSTTLPVEDSAGARAQPWILHILTVNSLNFCAFAMCHEVLTTGKGQSQAILLAVPDTSDSEGIDVFHLPTERRTGTIEAQRNVKTGMVMALAICETPVAVVIAAGYESGHTMLYSRVSTSDAWNTLYSCRPHTQPVLSLGSYGAYFITSSADAMIAKHPFLEASSSPMEALPSSPVKTVKTKHSGQQGLAIRSDNMIFATAGWDSRVRVYSCKTLKELAVLKWHREGCMTVAFAQVLGAAGSHDDQTSFSDTLNDPVEKTEDVAGLQISSGRENGRMAQEQALGIAHEVRQEKALRTHWIAAGSKDGKVSLWDIY